MTYILTVRQVPINSPKHRVWKPTTGSYRGLWNVSRHGSWVAAYGSWERAVLCAFEGVIS